MRILLAMSSYLPKNKSEQEHEDSHHDVPVKNVPLDREKITAFDESTEELETV